jgi:isopenicillin N synthase-like dioxygenase
VGSLQRGMPTIGAERLLAADDGRRTETVRRACRDTGFFCVELDAPRAAIVEATIATMQRFFALADDDPVKRAVRRDGRDRGWIPRYSEPAYQPGTVSSLEAFDVDLEHLPPGEFWPALAGFRDAVTACWDTYLALADAVLRTIAPACELDTDFFTTRCASRKLNALRLLHYAADNARRDERSVGIAAHTDFECITLLYQSAPGLELLDVHDRWLDAPTGTGRILVMLDDMLERWTNGHFRATGHRVRETNQQRYSIVMFVAVDPDIDVAPLDRFISADSPARYPPVKQLDHIEAEVQKARANAAAIA